MKPHANTPLKQPGNALLLALFFLSRLPHPHTNVPACPNLTQHTCFPFPPIVTIHETRAHEGRAAAQIVPLPFVATSSPNLSPHPCFFPAPMPAPT